MEGTLEDLPAAGETQSSLQLLVCVECHCGVPFYKLPVRRKVRHMGIAALIEASLC